MVFILEHGALTKWHVGDSLIYLSFIQLSAIEKDETPAGEEMKTARLRTRDRLLKKKAQEASTAEESEAADETDAGDDIRMLTPTTLQLPDSRAETPSPRRTSRTPRTPRESHGRFGHGHLGVDQSVWWHMASLSHNESISWKFHSNHESHWPENLFDDNFSL